MATPTLIKAGLASEATSPGRSSAATASTSQPGKGVTFSGVIGYRAPSVDYSQGEGRQLHEFDVVQHGLVLGLSIRF